MKDLDKLAHVFQLKADAELAELTACRAACDAIASEIRSLSDLRQQTYGSIGPAMSMLGENWAAWQSARMLELRRKEAIARSALLEAEAKARQALARTEAVKGLQQRRDKENARRAAKRFDDNLDMLRAMASGTKPGSL